MSPLGHALLDSLTHDDLAALADLLVPYLTPSTQEDPWLDSTAAATYLSITRNALHKHTAARTIPFTQATGGGKLWFKRSDLDQWRGR